MQSLNAEHNQNCRRLLFLVVPVFYCLLVHPHSLLAGGLVRVSNGRSEFEGKVVALTPSTCSIIDRQGQLLRLDVRSLKSFEKVASRYTPLATTELRDELRKEFAGGYEVAGTTHYLVCAPAGKADRYAGLFEDIYRDVEHFYRVRGFNVQKPEVPLIAVVLRSQQEFVEYCKRDQVPASSGLMGYYSLKTNRVALFDDEQLLTDGREWAANPYSIAANSGIAGGAANTVIHETTHQVGYNIGIHSRLGGTPLWVVEGLATVLEPAGMRSSRGVRQLEDRLNTERVNWFRSKHRPSRPMGDLGRLVASDTFFHKRTLNSYSESWAFTFFLLENPARRRRFVTYLQQLGERDATQIYSAKQRLADFQAAFGDVSRLEVEFIRFMDRM